MWERLRPETPDHRADRAARVQAVADPAVDMVRFEKARVRCAIRPDFIRSAEIVVISLGTLVGAPMLRQVVALAAVGIGVTVLVYGVVAGLVTLDDLGLRLQPAGPGGLRYAVGTPSCAAPPWVMKTLSVLGTVAMFLVGGGILAHGIPPIEQLLHGLGGAVRAAADGAVGRRGRRRGGRRGPHGAGAARPATRPGSRLRSWPHGPARGPRASGPPALRPRLRPRYQTVASVVGLLLMGSS